MTAKRLKIVIHDNMRLREKAELATASMVIANYPDPSTFVFGSDLVRLKRVDVAGVERPVIDRFDVPKLLHVLEQDGNWFRQVVGRNGSVVELVIDPPSEVARDVLASGSWSFPIVEQIVTAPIFAPDGSIQRRPGYHRESRSYVAPAPGFTMPDLPDRPTKEDLAVARDLIFVDLLGDFPFAGAADIAHAAAAMLTPSTRALVAGPTPLVAINAPVKGTGKTLLARAIVYPTTGDAAAVNPEAQGEEEWRKRIGAWLSDGPQVVWIDNLQSKLSSGSFAAALTEEVWTDRLLGRNDVTIRYPIRPLWIVTGNNLNLSDEIARRSIPIRLDSHSENPHLRDRKSFRHPDLIGWMRANRGELVWALLVLVLYWQEAGSPPADLSLGSYDAWVSTIGGILEVAEIGGFLDNLEGFYEQFDPETRGWRAFVAAWWASYRNSTVRPSELIAEYESLDDDFANIGTSGPRSQTTRLGQRLLQKQGVIFDGKQITLTDTAQGGNRWRLVEVDGK